MTRASAAQVDRGTAFTPASRPARLNSADPALVEQVAAWRRMGMSWDAVGRALKRPTPDVRAAFDAGWMIAPPEAVAPAAPAKRGPGAAAKRALGELGPVHADLVLHLAAGADERQGLADKTGASPDVVSQRLFKLKLLGIAERAAKAMTGGWRLTRLGRAVAEILKEEGRGK